MVVNWPGSGTGFPEFESLIFLLLPVMLWVSLCNFLGSLNFLICTMVIKVEFTF